MKGGPEVKELPRDPFLHGVASGDVSAETAVIWTRVSGVAGDVTLTFEITDCESGSVVIRDEIEALLHRDFTAKYFLQDLKPGSRYTYQFSYAGWQSAMGQFKTLDPDADTIRFAVVACSKFNAGYFGAYRAIANEDLDFVVHLGDYIYETANVPPFPQTPGAVPERSFEPLGECRTLSEYRQRYSQYRRDPDVQALHRSHAMFATLDDHEIADNTWSGGADAHVERLHGPFSDRLENALRAWEEWMPVARGIYFNSAPIYTSWNVGNLARFVILETRTNRTSPEAPTESRSQLGPTQRSWLKEQIESCDSRWIFLLSPSMMTPIWSQDLDPLARSALATLKVINSEMSGPFHDLWDCYEVEREFVRELLLSTSTQPVVISGDVHFSVESVFCKGAAEVPEWTIPSVTSQNLDDKRSWPLRTESIASERAVLATHSDWKWCDFDNHGFLLLEVDRDRSRGEWRFFGDVRKSDQEQSIGHTVSIVGRGESESSPL